MDLTSFAKVLGGAKRLEGSGANRPTNVSRIVGTAVSDSADGKVLVDLDAQVFSGDGSQYVEIDTSDNVREGDRVYVDMVGADGRGKSLMISGAPGSGDRQQAEIDSAAELADAASAVASATAQHFWSDESGAHVSTDADDAEGNQNALWNSLGMLFRKGANNLLALVTGTNPGMLIYDGSGNADSNIIASFVGNIIELGRNSASAVIKMCQGIGVIRVDTNDVLTITYGEPSQTAPTIGLAGGRDGGGNLVEMTVSKVLDDGESRAEVMVVEASDGCDAYIGGKRIRGSASGTSGAIKPMGIYRVTMTTPANNGADVTININGAGDNDISVVDTNYCVFIQPEGMPVGFTHISYVVTDKYINAFKIHSYNDYTQAITQTLDVMVVHM